MVKESDVMMNWYRNGGMDGGSILLMTMSWIIILGVGFWFVAWITRRDKVFVSDETPRQILDRRFSLGEIDAKEYAQAKRLLEGHSHEAGEIR